MYVTVDYNQPKNIQTAVSITIFIFFVNQVHENLNFYFLPDSA